LFHQAQWILRQLSGGTKTHRSARPPYWFWDTADD
jgi:hypothetical protein